MYAKRSEEIKIKVFYAHQSHLTSNESENNSWSFSFFLGRAVFPPSILVSFSFFAFALRLRCEFAAVELYVSLLRDDERMSAPHKRRRMWHFS